MFPLGSVFGVRVGAHWSLVAALVLAGWAFGAIGGLILSLSLFASVLVHELAHAIVAVKRGVSVEGVELGVFGGATRLAPSPEHELAIAMAGPLGTAVIVVVSSALFSVTRSSLVLWLLLANGVLFVSNALPILPLDGGRAVRALLSRRMDRVRATRLTMWLNRALSVVTLGIAVAIASSSALWLALPAATVAVLVWFLGAFEVRRVEAQAARDRFLKPAV